MTSTTAIKKADACTLVVFGAGGDLTKRLLVPALANLADSQLLSPNFNIVGVLHSPLSDDAYRKQIADDVIRFGKKPERSEDWMSIGGRIRTVSGEFDDDAMYAELSKVLTEVEGTAPNGRNRLYYLATAPEYFGLIAKKLQSSTLSSEKDGWRRLVVEKPFGHDLASAKALNSELAEIFGENRIYRIDHYLGKETVQNMLALRFANGMFEPMWNRNYIDHVQITVAETVGVESRGRFYDQTGAMRDMVQNHLFQLLAMTALEPPYSLAADAIRDEKAKVLLSIQEIKPEDVPKVAVRAQYADAEIDGKQIVGYTSEPKVDPNSRTETFAAIKVVIDTWRWGGVPFYLRTGKHLAAKTSEIAIAFNRAPQQLFCSVPGVNNVQNWLVLRIQPNEGIFMEFGVKHPGTVMTIRPVDMDFSYAQYFGVSKETGYETLLYDAMIGDQTLFQRADQVEAGWAVVQPVLDAWAATKTGEIPQYASGTWGPAEADELLARDGREWRLIRPDEYKTPEFS